MDRKIHESFCRQLTIWAKGLLAQGRYPFRRVDQAPVLQTAAGPLTPDLVLWINRDSLMAGGIILVSSGDRSDALKAGRQCATALGLRHFVTWEANQVLFHEVEGDTVLPCRRLSAPPPGSDGRAFCKTLAETLDVLKFLSISGAMAPDEMPPDYLLNLCLGTLQDVLPALEELLRIVRSEREWPSSGGDVEVQSRDKALLTLVRLLALVHCDQIAVTVQPEGLERAMFFALDGLPEILRKALAPVPGELPLPLEVAIRFHLYLRRMSQLELRRNPARTAELLYRLLSLDPLQTGLLPAAQEVVPLPAGADLRFNALRVPAGAEEIECAPPSILGALALLRTTRNLPHPGLQKGDILTGEALPSPRRVRAALWNRLPLAPSDRLATQTALRLSWPNQRFSLPSNIPRWACEALHLIGLAANGASLELATPGGWLQESWADWLMQAVVQQSAIAKIDLSPGTGPVFFLEKGKAAQLPLTVFGPDHNRDLNPADRDPGLSSYLLLALLLPEDLWQLYAAGHLRSMSQETWPLDLERGIFLFSRSTPGRRLWQALTGNRTLPAASRLQPAILQRGLPLPCAAALQHLQQADPGSGTSSQRQRALIDQELGPWFPPQAFCQGEAAAAAPATKERTPEEELQSIRELLRQTVFADGLPCFPDHYLFAHYRPRLAHFRFSLPLQRVEEFFGSVVFRDAQKVRIEAANPEVASALELVAGTGREEVDLPTEQDVATDILQRYLEDLRRLHRELLHQAHARLHDRGQARDLAESLWSELQLPPPSLFTE